MEKIMYDIYEDLPMLMQEYMMELEQEAIASLSIDRCTIMDADGFIIL